jgi:hypothetical protein
MSFFEIMHITKKHSLIIGGDVCRRIYFFSEGCLREFFIILKGIGHTLNFPLRTGVFRIAINDSIN